MSGNEKMHTWGGHDTRFKGMVGHLDYRQHHDKQFNDLERVNALRDESDEAIRVYGYNEWLRNEWKKYCG